MKRNPLLVIILGAACVASASCESPEAVRQRGGGPGGDIGNRPEQVKMHEGSRQYWKTPVQQDVPGERMPLGPSEQAREVSTPGRSRSSSPAPDGTGARE